MEHSCDGSHRRVADTGVLGYCQRPRKDSFCIDKTFDRWAVHLTNTIARTDNAASDNGTMTKTEILKLKGGIGKGINTAPGLQKPFNLKSQAAKHTVNSDNVTLTKAAILKLMGVPGKGIETAPGLQKPFNPKSQAAEHAGKKTKTTIMKRNSENKAEQ